MNLKISIITINYNNREGLGKTLESVTSQEYDDYEYIVIDGGSNDGSKELIENYSEKISYWVSEQDKGIYNAMNKGIMASNGKFLLFLNSGDILYNKEVLSRVSKHLETEDIIYGDLEFANGKNHWISYYPEKIDLLHFYKSSLPHPATFIPRTKFKDFGLYDESLKIVADWKWFMLAICKKKATYKHINVIISTFYQDGISSNPDNIKKIEREIESVFKDEFPENWEIRNEIIRLNNDIKNLKNIEHKFNHLKKYRLVKFLNSLGIIKIPKQ